MTGDLLGTLRYMAPEQALARHGLADHRVDVYGLGCTLYELLTGKPAVGGEDKADILRHLAFEEPVALRKLDKAIPAELETIALKCLAKNPNERYATAGELAADLRRFLDDKPIKAKPPTLRQRAVKWSRACRGGGGDSGRVAGRHDCGHHQHDHYRPPEAPNGRCPRSGARGVCAAREALDELSSQVIDEWLAQQPMLTPEHRAFLQRAVAKYERFAAAGGRRRGDTGGGGRGVHAGR